MPAPTYPKRLIEVDLPIKKISEHARREKSIRHGHISTLHIWWARRPLAACRAVICAALWPDPADPLCPERFRCEAEDVMRQFWNPMGVTDRDFSDPFRLQQALLDFIADFSNWDHSTDERYLSTARKLTQVAHESLGGEPGTRPLVVDPFAGGGSIPLEALRVGADAYASDLNPVAVLLNKVVLEYIPKYGKDLALDVRKWGQWVKEETEKELAEFYPKDADGATPIAYLWARTIRCEGPGCGAEIPLIRSLWLAKKGDRSVGLCLIPDAEKKKIDFEIIENAKPSDVKEGTVKRGSATCPVCGYTTPVAAVRKQLKGRNGGTNDARLFCVISIGSQFQGKKYRLPNDEDFHAIRKAKTEFIERIGVKINGLDSIPNEQLPPQGALGFRVQQYGILHWNELFNYRQNLALITLVKNIRKISKFNESATCNSEKLKVIQTLLAFALDRQADYLSSLTIWANGGEFIAHTFGRQALPIVWEWPECQLFSEGSGNWSGAVEWIKLVIDELSIDYLTTGVVQRSSALDIPLPNDSASLYFTDPPYYDAVAYSDLSDFFYIWLKRTIGGIYPELFLDELTKKTDECIVDPIRNKDKNYFEKSMSQAMANGRSILKPGDLGVVVFAHKSTTGWEAQLNAMIDAGWMIHASWPIDTERPGRLRAQDSAALASSIHLVCRPRENPDGSLREEIGDWRDVLAELPGRIHDWMPRLAKEGVVGADAIFACLGPALEIFSRYSRVEKASGDPVPLQEYLEHVWAAVSREALGMIFEGADATGFEEDARITAIWLWTLKTAESPALNGKNEIKEQPEESEEEEEEAAEGSGKKKVKGFSLEYDAARKIAQGLGAHLEELHTLVEIKKGNARLLPVSERAVYLLKSEKEKPVRRPKKKEKQATLFPLEVEGGAEAEEDFGDVAEIGKTTLDRVHQSMLLFAAGQSDALKRFLVDEGIGKNAQFWILAQALAALYPTGTEEKRWVEGVLARKKGMGL